MTKNSTNLAIKKEIQFFLTAIVVLLIVGTAALIYGFFFCRSTHYLGCLAYPAIGFFSYLAAIILWIISLIVKKFINVKGEKGVKIIRLTKVIIGMLFYISIIFEYFFGIYRKYDYYDKDDLFVFIVVLTVYNFFIHKKLIKSKTGISPNFLKAHKLFVWISIIVVLGSIVNFTLTWMYS